MCKVIFQIDVIALVFMSCNWSINWVKTILDPTQTPIHLGFLWDTMGETITLPEYKTTQVEAWPQKLLAVNFTTQENLECYLGILISRGVPFITGLSKDRSLFSSKEEVEMIISVQISHHSIVRELEWWASGGLRTNRISP